MGVHLTIQHLNNTIIRVYGDEGAEHELHDAFMFSVPGAQFTPKFKSRLWDGKIYLYNLRTKTIYAGLLPQIIEHCVKCGYTYTELPSESVEKARAEAPDAQSLAKFVAKLKPPFTPSPYQLRSIYHALKNLRCVIQSPTGSGKSFILYCLTCWHLTKGRKVLLVVPTTGLVEQMASDFVGYSKNNGWISQDCIQKVYSGHQGAKIVHPIVITTWQSVWKNDPSWFKQFRVVFGDEAHQFKAKSLCTLMEKTTEAIWRVGCTGTIDDSQVNKLTLEGLFGTVYNASSTRQLISEGRLAKLAITGVYIKYPEVVRKTMKDANYRDEIRYITSNPQRNKFITDLAIAQKGNTLVLFNFVESHGKVLYDMIREAAPPWREVLYISGETAARDREAYRARIQKEEDAILVASLATVSTGVNIPSLETLIFAHPTKSKIRNLQSIGRGLRLAEGKESCHLYDIGDDLHWKSHQNYTLLHAVDRFRLYASEGFPFTFKEVSL